MEEKSICVFTQIYRNETHIHRAIKSVLEQSYSNFKLCILVSEKTKAVLNEYQKLDARVFLFDGCNDENIRSYYGQMVDIVKDSGCEYFTNIDADDWWDESYLEELISFAEMNKLDIAACGNYYVNESEIIIGVREQNSICLSIENIAVYLPYIYGFLRTIWGKMISSKLILEMNIDNLPDSSKYGGYGGDTIFIFNLLRNTSNIGIYEKKLYYYRVSSTSNSSVIKKGRLDSDELVFKYVISVISELGNIYDTTIDFLYDVYGYAIKDTISLLISQIDRDHLEDILYVLSKKTTLNFFLHNRNKILLSGKDVSCVNFADDIYRLIFNDLNEIEAKSEKKYLEIFFCIYSIWKNIVSETEFHIIIKDLQTLDAFAHLDLELAFDSILQTLIDLKNDDIDVCIGLLKKIAKNSVTKVALINKEFITRYSQLLSASNSQNEDYIFRKMDSFIKNEINPEYLENIMKLWINFAALKQNAQEFILGKKELMILYKKLDQLDKAKILYDELIDMGAAVDYSEVDDQEPLLGVL